MFLEKKIMAAQFYVKPLQMNFINDENLMHSYKAFKID